MANMRNMAMLYNMAMLHLLGLARQSPFNCFRRDLAVFNCRWTDPGRPGIQFAAENGEFTERFLSSFPSCLRQSGGEKHASMAGAHSAVKG